MTNEDLNQSLRRLYWLTASFGLLGFVSYFAIEGPRTAFGFSLGAGSSFGNLWLFNWLSRAIAPGNQTRKPWQAGAYIGRYLILFFAGYVIVNALGVNPLAVVLGLLASTAAVLALSVFEIIQGLLGKPSTR
ncbi:MAG: ATP synthase subunit I [Bryobacteraceae bacterium]